MSKWEIVDFEDAISDVTKLAAKIKKEESCAEEIPAEILKLVEARNIAKAQKDYAKSDELRKEIIAKGYNIVDTKNGVEIKRI